MTRTVNRLTVRDSLLSADPDSGLSIPLYGQNSYSSSVATFSETFATLLLPTTAYTFSVGERVDVVATDNNNVEIGTIFGERVLTLSESYGFRTNLVPNPSFETGNASAWYINSSSVGTVGVTGIDAWRGNYSASLATLMNPGYIEFGTSPANKIPIIGNTACRATARVKNGPGVECDWRLAFSWYTGGSLISRELGPITESLVEIDEWTEIEYIRTSPALADSCLVWIIADGQSGDFSIGDYVFVDAIMLENAPSDDPTFSLAKSRPYFDGLTGYSSWNGTASISSSTIQPLQVIGFVPSDPPAVIPHEFSASINGSITPVYSHRWVSTNSFTETVSTNFETTSRYVLRVSPSSSSPISFSLSNVKLLRSDYLRNFQFNAKIYTNSTSTILGRLSLTGSLESLSPVSTVVYGGRYSAIRTNVLTIPDVTDPLSDYYESEYIYVDIELVISNHDAKEFFITLPHLVDDELYYTNWFVQNSRNFMPDFLWDYDVEQENPKAPMHKLIDSMMAIAGDTYDTYVEMTEYEKDELGSLSNQVLDEFRSSLVNPLYAKNEYLPWLSQFAGTKVKRNIIGSNNQKLLPNAETENEYARWQANTGYYGLNAGTRQAVVEAARQALIFTKNGESPTKAVAVTNRLNGDVFTIRVQTLLNETMDVTIEGGSSQFVLDAVEPARPLGYKIVHTTTSAFSFTLGDESLGILGNVGLG